jgi:hypothetical protein
MASAREELSRICTEESLSLALKRKPAEASDHVLVPGQDALVWREKGGWTGPYLLSRLERLPTYTAERENLFRTPFPLLSLSLD